MAQYVGYALLDNTQDVQRTGWVQPIQRRQLPDVPGQCNIGAFHAWLQPETQGGQQQQEIGFDRFHGVDRQLQVIHAVLENLRHLGIAHAALLHRADGADQGGAEPVMHILHQALAFVA